MFHLFLVLLVISSITFLYCLFKILFIAFTDKRQVNCVYLKKFFNYLLYIVFVVVAFILAYWILPEQLFITLFSGAFVGCLVGLIKYFTSKKKQK